MLFKIGLENGTEGRSIAWVLDYPGCFAYGHDGDEALDNIPQAIQGYSDWIARHDSHPWVLPVDHEFHLEETWEVYAINEDYQLVEDGYEVNAWFLNDWRPLTGLEIERGLKMLSWSRSDLLETVGGLNQAALDEKHPHERWTIAGILGHIGGAEWWYLNRLGLDFPREQVPEDPFARLEIVRAHLLEILPGLAGSNRVAGIAGEFWSPRKLLRRALWHERDHTFHIQKLLSHRREHEL